MRTCNCPSTKTNVQSMDVAEEDDKDGFKEKGKSSHFVVELLLRNGQCSGLTDK